MKKEEQEQEVSPPPLSSTQTVLKPTVPPPNPTKKRNDEILALLTSTSLPPLVVPSSSFPFFSYLFPIGIASLVVAYQEEFLQHLLGEIPHSPFSNKKGEAGDGEEEEKEEEVMLIDKHDEVVICDEHVLVFRYNKMHVVGHYFGSTLVPCPLFPKWDEFIFGTTPPPTTKELFSINVVCAAGEYYVLVTKAPHFKANTVEVMLWSVKTCELVWDKKQIGQYLSVFAVTRAHIVFLETCNAHHHHQHQHQNKDKEKKEEEQQFLQLRCVSVSSSSHTNNNNNNDDGGGGGEEGEGQDILVCLDGFGDLFPNQKWKGPMAIDPWHPYVLLEAIYNRYNEEEQEKNKVHAFLFNVETQNVELTVELGYLFFGWQELRVPNIIALYSDHDGALVFVHINDLIEQTTSTPTTTTIPTTKCISSGGGGGSGENAGKCKTREMMKRKFSTILKHIPSAQHKFISEGGYHLPQNILLSSQFCMLATHIPPHSLDMPPNYFIKPKKYRFIHQVHECKFFSSHANPMSSDGGVGVGEEFFTSYRGKIKSDWNNDRTYFETRMLTPRPLRNGSYPSLLTPPLEIEHEEEEEEAARRRRIWVDITKGAFAIPGILNEFIFPVLVWSKVTPTIVVRPEDWDPFRTREEEAEEKKEKKKEKEIQKKETILLAKCELLDLHSCQAFKDHPVVQLEEYIKANMSSKLRKAHVFCKKHLLLQFSSKLAVFG